MLRCLKKALKIVTELGKGFRLSINFANRNFKYQERLDKIVEGKLATDWSKQVICLIYARTTEYYGCYMKWVEHFYIKCRVVPSKLKYKKHYKFFQ